MWHVKEQPLPHVTPSHSAVVSHSRAQQSVSTLQPPRSAARGWQHNRCMHTTATGHEPRAERPSWRHPRTGADGRGLTKDKPALMFSWCQTITRIFWSIRMPCGSSTICIFKYLLFTFTRRYNLFLFIHVIFVTFNMAAATFQSRRRFKHVPQGFHASFTIGWEVVKSRYKLMSFVTNVIWLLSHGLHRKFLLLFALSFISI